MKRKENQKKKNLRIKGHLDCVNLFAAGIDIGSISHFVAVPMELDDQYVREYPCFTKDLINLADWLIQIGIQTVAMESTGVYWIPLYEILEERGLKVLLVNQQFPLTTLLIILCLIWDKIIQLSQQIVSL